MDDRDLAAWVPRPALRIAHQAPSRSAADELWHAAQEIRLRDTRLLGRLIRWRIPGVASDVSFQGLFSGPPFLVLYADERRLISGLVGRIWTLRRDYPKLEDPEEFRDWSRGGTARVAFAHWVEEAPQGSVLHSEARVQAFGVQGRIGLAGVRPLIRTFQHLIRTDALETAVRAAEG